MPPTVVPARQTRKTTSTRNSRKTTTGTTAPRAARRKPKRASAYAAAKGVLAAAERAALAAPLPAVHHAVTRADAAALVRDLGEQLRAQAIALACDGDRAIESRLAAAIVVRTVASIVDAVNGTVATADSTAGLTNLADAVVAHATHLAFLDAAAGHLVERAHALRAALIAYAYLLATGHEPSLPSVAPAPLPPPAAACEQEMHIAIVLYDDPADDTFVGATLVEAVVPASTIEHYRLLARTAAASLPANVGVEIEPAELGCVRQSVERYVGRGAASACPRVGRTVGATLGKYLPRA